MERNRQADDPYRQLGLTEGASLEQVSRAYRKLVHDSHPDTHSGDAEAAERFRAAVEAHEWIVEQIRRSEQARSRSAIPVRHPSSSTDSPVRAAAQPPLRVGPLHWERGGR